MHTASKLCHLVTTKRERERERERERRREREKEKKRKSNQGEKVAAQLCHLVIEAGLLVAAALTPVLDLLGLEEVAEQRLN